MSLPIDTHKPLPPPPPPPLLPTNSKALNENVINIKNSKPTLFEDCLFAAEWPELQKACYLARIMEKPKVCQYRDIPAKLQLGPTCGLTALSLLLEGKPTPDELLEVAKALKYTNNGEMFSADYLHRLILKYFTTSNEAIDCVQLFRGTLDCKTIKEHLKRNACIFVPYPFQKDNA